MGRNLNLRSLAPALVLVILALGVMACSSSREPSPDAGVASAATSTTPRPANQPLPATPVANSPWEAEWKKTVAAAKREGKAVLSGPPGEDWRKALLSFERDFPDIRVEYIGSNSRDFWPRLLRERELGQYLWDLRVGGPDPQVFAARDRGVLDSVRPLLLLPEVVDEGKWFGGFKGLFVDKERKYIAGFLAYASAAIFVNRDVISEAEFRSDADLLNPRWKGKIVLQDPRGGAGLGSMTVLLAVHGEPFVRDLLSQQNVVVTSDVRQQAEWVVRGRYPIGIGVLPDQLLNLKEQGLKLNVQRLKEGSVGFSTGFGGIQLINRAPHPNAATVFINWLLQQKTQSRLTQALRLNSRRLDVPPGDLESVIDAKRIQDYVPHQSEELLPLRQRSVALAAKLLR